jgi:hypothetical protein
VVRAAKPGTLGADPIEECHMYMLMAVACGVAFIALLVIAVRALARLLDGPTEQD